MHFVHQPGRGDDPLPLVMTHGWPGTVWEIAPLGAARWPIPSAHAARPAPIPSTSSCPSIPGFGFSGEPIEGTDVDANRRAVGGAHGSARL